jgi:hypothetical protein
MNYAFGLTRIRLRQYVLASFVCMAPGALAYPTWAVRGARRPPGSREESAWLCSLLRCSRPLLSCRGCRYRFCDQTNEGIRQARCERDIDARNGAALG